MHHSSLTLATAATLLFFATATAVPGASAADTKPAASNACTGDASNQSLTHVTFTWRRMPEVSDIFERPKDSCLPKRRTWVIMEPDAAGSDAKALDFVDNQWGLIIVEVSGTLRCLEPGQFGLGHLGSFECELVVRELHAAKPRPQ